MSLKADFSETGQTFPARFSSSGKFGANFGKVQTVTEYIGGEGYEGDYIVTPKVEPQTLPTKGKVMLDDVAVKSIPYFDVSNTSGGSTVYIGSEV